MKGCDQLAIVKAVAAWWKRHREDASKHMRFRANLSNGYVIIKAVSLDDKELTHDEFRMYHEPVEIYMRMNMLYVNAKRELNACQQK